MNHFKVSSEGNCFCIAQEYGLGSTSGGRACDEKSRPRSVEGVRVGKTITFKMGGSDSPESREKLDKLCDGCYNPVIEDYRFEIEEG